MSSDSGRATGALDGTGSIGLVRRAAYLKDLYLSRLGARLESPEKRTVSRHLSDQIGANILKETRLLSEEPLFLPVQLSRA